MVAKKQMINEREKELDEVRKIELLYEMDALKSPAEKGISRQILGEQTFKNLSDKQLWVLNIVIKPKIPSKVSNCAYCSQPIRKDNAKKVWFEDEDFSEYAYYFCGEGCYLQGVKKGYH